MSGLNDFRSYFSSFVGLIAAGVATTALVLVSYMADIFPPWPAAVTQITAISQLIVLVLVYQFLERSKKSAINKTMIVSSISFALLILMYLALFSLLTFEMPNGTLDVRGLECTSAAISIYGDECPFLTEDSLADDEFTPETFWTPVGLILGRLSLLGVWMMTFSSCVTLFATFVVYQRKRSTPTKRP